jgi:hypothetical protein
MRWIDPECRRHRVTYQNGMRSSFSLCLARVAPSWHILVREQRHTTHSLSSHHYLFPHIFNRVSKYTGLSLSLSLAACCDE